MRLRLALAALLVASLASASYIPRGAGKGRWVYHSSTKTSNLASLAGGGLSLSVIQQDTGATTIANNPPRAAVIPVAGRIIAMRCRVRTAPGGGNTLRFATLKNYSSYGLSFCDIAGTNQTCSVTGSAAYAAGDRITHWVENGGGSPTLAQTDCVSVFEAD